MGRLGGRSQRDPSNWMLLDKSSSRGRGGVSNLAGVKGKHSPLDHKTEPSRAENLIGLRT